MSGTIMEDFFLVGLVGLATVGIGVLFGWVLRPPRSPSHRPPHPVSRKRTEIDAASAGGKD
jgi:hypothetical protein